MGADWVVSVQSGRLSKAGNVCGRFTSVTDSHEREIISWDEDAVCKGEQHEMSVNEVVLWPRASA